MRALAVNLVRVRIYQGEAQCDAEVTDRATRHDTQRCDLSHEMTARMLQGGYLSVLEATTPLDFRNEVVRFAESFGFKTVSAMAVIDPSHGA